MSQDSACIHGSLASLFTTVSVYHNSSTHYFAILISVFTLFTELCTAESPGPVQEGKEWTLMWYRITGYFCGPEIFAFCSKTLDLIFCEFKFMRLIGAAK